MRCYFHFLSDVFFKSAFIFNKKVMHILTYLVTLACIFLFFVCGASAVGTDSVSLLEGDAVTLYTGVKMNQQDRITWFCGDYRIAVINGDQSKICADDQCKERFRDRLKLDHQTGSLTITNINTTDSGVYKVKITSQYIEKIFNVTVHGVSAAERDKMKRESVKEGEYVTFDPGVLKNPNDVMTWYFNDILLAEITGDQSQTCTDDQCKERFRDRLKLDQTGSLTITNTDTTDSGEYTLQISSSSGFSIIRSYTITVTYVSDSGWSSVAVVVVVVLVLLLLVAAMVYCKRQAIMKCIRRQRNDRRDDAGNQSLEQIDTLMPSTCNGTPHNNTEAASET